MDKQLRREAVRQYLHYFRFWFAAVAVVLVVLAATAAFSLTGGKAQRRNSSSPAERVYDYAGVLTEGEELKLRELIAGTESRIQCDIVLVTIAEDIEKEGMGWETGMMELADNFYDENNYGYNGVHGDGALILDNWYDGQKGSWLSTCGSVYQRFSSSDITQVLEAGYDIIDADPYKAYVAYIEMIEHKMSGRGAHTFPPILILVIPLCALAVFMMMKLKSKIGDETVGANEYVPGGQPVMKEKSDRLVNKFVTTRRIPRNTGGGGGSHGGGGGHVSSGGVSHGGGGMRR